MVFVGLANVNRNDEVVPSCKNSIAPGGLSDFEVSCCFSLLIKMVSILYQIFIANTTYYL